MRQLRVFTGLGKLRTDMPLPKKDESSVLQRSAPGTQTHSPAHSIDHNPWLLENHWVTINTMHGLTLAEKH